MFRTSLALAFSVVSLVQPAAASVTYAATVAVCFAPEDDCDAFAVRAIDGAAREILVSAYRLTVGSGVVGALIRAKERGTNVQVITDREAPCGWASGIDPLAAAGVPIWIDDRARMAHQKTVVIDGAATLQGSYNWTRGAASNSEDLNLISSPAIAEAYAGHWRQRLGISVPFTQRAGAALRRQKRTDERTARFSTPNGRASQGFCACAGGQRRCTSATRAGISRSAPAGNICRRMAAAQPKRRTAD